MKNHRIRVKFIINSIYKRIKYNKTLRDKLLATENKILVEAADYDNIWGIGYNEENAMKNINSWGSNLLGKVLMEVRDK